MTNSFARMCAILAAIRCHQSGQTIAAIAASAGRHPSTIRRWLKAAP